MAKGDRYWRMYEKREAMNAADNEGIVADSVEVRKALMAKVFSGECTLEQVQAELALIKRNAKKNGKVTRSQAYQGRRPEPSSEQEAS